MRIREDGMSREESQQDKAVCWKWTVGLLALLIGGICAALLAGGGAVGAGDDEGRWLPTAARSPAFVTFAGVAVGCALLAAWLGGGLAALGRRTGRAGADEGGAMVEFALVLPFLLMIVLVMVQSALLMGGQLCVNYAAFCAARSAAVQIPRDMGLNEPPNWLGDRKTERVRLAAVWAVLPISYGGYDRSYSQGQILRDGLERFFDRYGQQPPGWIDDRLGRKLAYADQHTEVELAEPDQTQTYTLETGEQYTGFAANTDVTVELGHVLHLSVPFASRVFAAADDGVKLDGGGYGMRMTTHCTLINQGRQDYVDVETWD